MSICIYVERSGGEGEPVPILKTDNRKICVAALACPRKLLKQEQPGEIPMTDPSICQGCADCARACPLKAIQIVRT